MASELSFGDRQSEEQFRYFAALMTGADRDIKNALTRTLRAELKPVVVDLKHAAAGIPSKGGGARTIVTKTGGLKKAPANRRPPLRRVIAASIFVGVNFKGKRVGATIAIKRKQLEQIFGGDAARRLPELLDSTYLSTFQHPAINQPDVIVTQKAYNWFFPVWHRHEVKVTKAVHREVALALGRLVLRGLGR